MSEITEEQIRQGLVSFVVGGRCFVAQFINPNSEGPPGQVVNESKWVLSEMRLQSHRKGKPIKRSLRKRKRRPKKLAVLDSLADCRLLLDKVAPHPKASDSRPGDPRKDGRTVDGRSEKGEG